MACRCADGAPVRRAGGRGCHALSVAAAAAYWRDLRDQRHAFFAQDGAPLWRLSVPTVAPALPHVGTQLVEWGGGQRWLRSAETPEAIRVLAARHGGHATLYRGGAREQGVFHPLAPAVHTIHRNLKRAFDPAGIFNPGRMYQDL
jgi:glycolate oxidase FAD binding subunit